MLFRSLVMEIAGKKLTLRHIPGPLGVRGRNSDNRLIREKLGWSPSRPLREGLEKTYQWIAGQVKASGTNGSEKEALGTDKAAASVATAVGA